MKIKFNLDGDLPLNKVIEIPNVIIVARTVFYEIKNVIHNVYINYDGRIAISEGIDVNKRSASKNLDIWHNWDFLNKGFKFL